MSKRKPIRVFFGAFSETFYASQHYKETPLEDGTSRFEITGVKYDVTDDILYAIEDRELDADAFERIREHRESLREEGL